MAPALLIAYCANKKMFTLQKIATLPRHSDAQLKVEIVPTCAALVHGNVGTPASTKREEQGNGNKELR